MLRRDMLRYTGAALLACAADLGDALTAFADDKPQEKTPQPAPPQQAPPSKQEFPFFTKKISLEEIAEEVKKTHREILEGTGITYLAPETYATEVYQRTAAEKMPVLVFFYGTDDEREVCASKRLAVVVKHLAIHFEKKLKFCAYDEGKYGGGRATQVGTGRMFSETARREGVTAIPSYVLYDTKDVIKTYPEGEKKILIIDRSQGGPRTDQAILPNIRNAANYLIRESVFLLDNPDNNGVIHRYENGQQLKPVSTSLK